MSLIPFEFLNRSMFDWDRPSTLDIFDPFDELDHALGRNLMWLSRPDFMRPFTIPRVPHKYRVTLDVSGFKPSSIKTDINGNKITVSAREEEKESSDNYSVREFKKTYELPAEAETEKLVSFVTRNGQLIIEAPLKHQQKNNEMSEFLPKISEDGKSFSLNLSLPKNIDPAKVSVTCKDRDLIIKAEDKIDKPDSMSSYSFYKRSTLPENTDFDAIKCHFDNSKLAISAPLLPELKQNSKKIPIENVKQN